MNGRSPSPFALFGTSAGCVLLLLLTAVAFCIPAGAEEPRNDVADAERAAPSEEEIERWVKELGDERFAVRTEAEQKLTNAAVAAVPAVLRVKGSEDREVRVRADRILLSIELDAAERIRAAGGDVNPDPDRFIDHHGGASLERVKNPKEALRWLPALTRLKHLHITGVDVTPDDLAPLASLQSVTFFYIKEVPLTDAGLVHISKMNGLTDLLLQDCDIKGTGLACLADLPRLRYLHVSHSALDPGSTVHLLNYPSLEQLILWETPINDESLTAISQIERLSLLILTGTGITDAGVPKFIDLKHLEQLRLDDTRITNESLPHLIRLESLRNLSLTRTRVTSDGLLQFKSVKSPMRLFVPGHYEPRVYDLLRQEMPHHSILQDTSEEGLVPPVFD